MRIAQAWSFAGIWPLKGAPSEMPYAQATNSIPLHRQWVDVCVLIELTTEVMQRQAWLLGIALDIRIAEDVPAKAYLDRDKVAWAVTNLVGSALRHVRKPGGAVSIEVGWKAEGRSLYFTVTDDGPGIDADRLRHLLDRGHWHPGGALALLLVSDIAEAHGGSVVIQTKAEPSLHFTSASFTIPLG